MINFVLYLIVICALGFVALCLQSAHKYIQTGTFKRTMPVADEFTRQLVGESVPEAVERARLTVPVSNTHWFTHTFERPRRKVKR